LGFGGELGDDAELLHEAQSVPVDIAFRQLAVQEASDGHAGDGERLSGRGNAVEIAFVGTVARPTGHDGIAFGSMRSLAVTETAHGLPSGSLAVNGETSTSSCSWRTWVSRLIEKYFCAKGAPALGKITGLKTRRYTAGVVSAWDHVHEQEDWR
jgi:hypothetical protein